MSSTRQKLFGAVLLVLFAANSLQAATQSSVSQYGMTFYFDKAYEVGKFANGDYWVLGPVTITRITPDFNGNSYGWEVNPKVMGSQGFQNGCYGGGFQAALVPKLPYYASGVKSIVKTMPSGDDRPCIKTAAVLTVVDKIPPENGATVFRPPYVGLEKPFFSTKSLRTEFLPSLPVVAATPPLSWVYERYHKVQLDHKGGGLGRALHPSDHMPDYGGDIGRDNADGVLRLCLDDPLNEKMPGLIAYIQYGIDIHHMVYIGQTWPGGGGHRPGQLIVLALSALMLDDARMKENLTPAKVGHQLHEYKVMFWSKKQQRALYGYYQHSSESDYWYKLKTQSSGGKSIRDIYDYIDGGWAPGGNYQGCCTSQPWKGEALAMMLIPELKAVWNEKTFYDYVDRWVTFGVVTQPDPCAPTTQGGGHDAATGSCKRDPDLEYYNGPTDFKCKAGAKCGRFPDLHGTRADEGGRKSYFQMGMWKAYRNNLPVTNIKSQPVTQVNPSELQIPNPVSSGNLKKLANYNGWDLYNLAGQDAGNINKGMYMLKAGENGFIKILVTE